MNSLAPKSYSEALARKRASDARRKPRSPLKRGGGLKMRRVSKKPTGECASERSIRDECDRLTREIVLRKERQCFIPNCRMTDLQCGHLFERRHQVTRYDTHPSGNNHAQCSYHNALHEEMPEIYRRAFIERYGSEAYAVLVQRKDLPIRRTYVELISIRDGLREELKQWQAR
jgi:hypothetical protein